MMVLLRKKKTISISSTESKIKLFRFALKWFERYPYFIEKHTFLKITLDKIIFYQFQLGKISKDFTKNEIRKLVCYFIWFTGLYVTGFYAKTILNNSLNSY